MFHYRVLCLLITLINESVKLLQSFVAVFGEDHLSKMEFKQVIGWRKTCVYRINHLENIFISNKGLN